MSKNPISVNCRVDGFHHFPLIYVKFNPQNWYYWYTFLIVARSMLEKCATSSTARIDEECRMCHRMLPQLNSFLETANFTFNR